MSIWRRLLGVPTPPKLKPELGQLCRFDDENVLHVFEVSKAEFNFYEDEGYFWLTLYVLAEVKISPQDDMNPEPHIEVNLPFNESPETKILPGIVLKATAYHRQLANLASMYYFTHCSFDGGVHIEGFDGETLTARLEGQSDDDPVVCRAVFRRNTERERSFC
jgi:hypothetical protein